MKISSLTEIFTAFNQLLFPYTCAGCGSGLLDQGAGVCSRCTSDLPVTGYLHLHNNAVEEIFWGRIHLEHAAACCFFNKKSLVQQLMHGIKYQHRQDAALQLGRWMGYQLKQSSWFHETDLILPMPLHQKRKQERGYNQAALLCDGITEITGKQNHPEALLRKSATHTQTKQHRAERWENMRQAFSVTDPDLLAGKHVLLIDDVVTTGASLEAVAEQLLLVPNLTLSICCFAYTLPH